MRKDTTYTKKVRRQDDRTVEHALAALERTTGLKANIVEHEVTPRAGHRVDALVQIKREGKQPFTYQVAVKAVDQTAALATVKQAFAELDGNGLLIAPYVTAALADKCRELEIPFLDTAGNAYLRAPGLYVFIRGEKRPEFARATATRGGATAAGLRVAFALLCKPDLLNAPYREIARIAGVALGAVGPVLENLAQRGHIAGGTKKRNRRLLEPERLLDEWVTNYPLKLRPKLHPRRFRAPNRDWWNEARLPEGAIWGGEIAADRLTNYLKPATATIYLEPTRRRELVGMLVANHRLAADPRGDIEMLDTFWRFAPDQERPELAPPILVYADLAATLEPRNLEVAALIRERFLAHAVPQV